MLETIGIMLKLTLSIQSHEIMKKPSDLAVLLWSHKSLLWTQSGCHIS